MFAGKSPQTGCICAYHSAQKGSIGPIMINDDEENKKKPLTNEEMDEITKSIIEQRVKQDYEISKYDCLFRGTHPRGEQLNIKTGPWADVSNNDFDNEVD